jgi:hypothetical protein
MGLSKWKLKNRRLKYTENTWETQGKNHPTSADYFEPLQQAHSPQKSIRRSEAKGRMKSSVTA